MEVSLFANLKTLWIVAVTISMFSYLQENVYMVKGHRVSFRYCNGVEKISMWIFFESLKNICYKHLLQYNSFSGLGSQYFVCEVHNFAGSIALQGRKMAAPLKLIQPN